MPGEREIVEALATRVEDIRSTYTRLNTAELERCTAAILVGQAKDQLMRLLGGYPVGTIIDIGAGAGLRVTNGYGAFEKVEIVR